VLGVGVGGGAYHRPWKLVIGFSARYGVDSSSFATFEGCYERAG
jgi:hypothetical protein